MNAQAACADLSRDAVARDDLATPLARVAGSARASDGARLQVGIAP